MLPILNKLTFADLYRNIPEGVGPRVCVLCDGQASAIEVECMLKDTISKARLGLNVCVGSRGQKIDLLKLNIELSNGADILIISPLAFSEHKVEEMINLQRCCHLVIETADKTLKNHEDAVESFFSKWRKQRKLLSFQSEIPDQVVVLAQEWDESLFKFNKFLIKRNLHPMMIFASHSLVHVYKNLYFLLSKVVQVD